MDLRMMIWRFGRIYRFDREYFVREPRAVDVVVGHVAGQTEPFDHGLRVGVEVLRVGLEVDSSAGNLHLCVLAQEEG